MSRSLSLDAPAFVGGRFLENLGEAFANLRAQGRRSALALLGILIGAASIVAMLNVGHIAQQESFKLFANMGVDMLRAQAFPNGSRAAGFDLQTLEGLARNDPDIVAATPLSTGRGDAVANGRDADAGIVAMTPALQSLARLRIEEGRALTAFDDCSPVAVIGAELARTLSSSGEALGPGALVSVGGYGFTVVGRAAPITVGALEPADYNKAIMIPLACSRRVLPAEEPNTALFTLRSGADFAAVGARITPALENPRSTLQVVDARAVLETMNAQQAVHNRMLAAVGGISLLVGGIGVMNVMLMSVMERRREIGVRAAVGATPRDIRQLFLIEAAALALVGGLVGSGFGVAAAYVIAETSGWTFSLALSLLPVGPAAASLVGLVFGIYPALIASRLDPIEALRAE